MEGIEVIEKLSLIEGYIKNIASMNYIIMLNLAIIGLMYLFYKFLKIFI